MIESKGGPVWLEWIPETIKVDKSLLRQGGH